MTENDPGGGKGKKAVANPGPGKAKGAGAAVGGEKATRAAVRVAGTAVEMAPELVERIEGAPRGPGVYLFKDSRGKVIYAGKAKSLRSRLRSYARGGDGRYQVRFLIERAEKLETIVTSSEDEALILENNLIKQYKPRYNIRLRDDKTYLSVKVTSKDRWPRLLVTRRILRDGNTYLGPFASASALRETVETIRRVFPLRTCSDAIFANRSRPCLEYQIKRCLAPCVLPVERGEYQVHLDGALQLLEGKIESLVADLCRQMKKASDSERFEDAARLRDRIAAVERMAERQKVVDHGGGDRDVFGLYREGGLMEAAVLMVRSGKMVGHRSYSFEDHELPDDEVLSSFLARFYERQTAMPDELLLPFGIEGRDVLASHLGRRRGRRVVVLVPRRGEKRRLVEMAMENAAHAFAERNDKSARYEVTAAELQKKLGLASAPKRIECFDISHVQGEAVVASMVAFDEGSADKDGYRRYRLKGVQRNDDFAAMKEVLRRRLGRGKKEGGLPDLLVVDGGRGQLAMAVEAMAEIGIEGVDVCALAKEKVAGDPRAAEVDRDRDRVYRPGRANALVLRRNSGAIFLLARIRDEAHRFAIAYHRLVRSKSRMRSSLDDVSGVGPAKRRALLRRFGSVRRIGEASSEELGEVAGITHELAGRILAALNNS